MADDLRKKTAKGLLWNSIHQFGMQGIQFCLMLVMARILSPSDYGILGLYSVFFALASIFIYCGFTEALIRKQNRTQTDMSTVFFFNVGMSIICYIIIFIIAPFVADFYKMPIITNLMRVAGLSVIFNALMAIHGAVMNFTLNFKTQAKISLTHSSVAGIAGLIFALCGLGVWSLILQGIVQSICGIILFWTLSKWRPTWEFSTKSVKEFWDYGSKLIVIGLINTIYNNIYPIVIGKSFSAATLGHYSRAHHWASFPSTNLTNMLKTVSFASLVKIQDDDIRLERVYRKMIRTSAFIIIPAMAGLSAIAKPLIYVVIGEKWALCASILQVICFTYMLAPIHSLNLNLLKVKGRTDLTLRISIVQKVLAIIALIIALPYGILAMCYAGIITSFLMLFMNTYYTGKFINVGFIRQMRDILPSFILSMIMMAIVFLIQSVIPNIYLNLIVSIIIGIAFYYGFSVLFKFEELEDAKTIIHDMIQRKKNKKI